MLKTALTFFFIVFLYHINAAQAPTASISGYIYMCQGNPSSGSQYIAVSLTGTGPWSFIYSDGTNDISVNNVSTASYNIYPTNTSSSTYILRSVSDANGPGTVSGSAYVNVQPKTPPTVTIQNGTDIRACGSQNFVLTSDAPETKWYSDPQGLNLIGQQSSFTTGVYNYSTTIYASSRWNGSNSCWSDLVPVNLTVNNTLAAPSINDIDLCGPDYFTISASLPAGVSSIILEGSDGSYLGSGVNYSGYASASKVIYAYYYISGISPCQGIKKTININVHPVPSAPLPYNSNNMKACGGTPITFREFSGVGYPEGNFKWYNYSYDYATNYPVYTLINGVSTSSYTEINAPSTRKVFYVSYVEPTTGCESQKTLVNGEWLPLPSAPTGIQQSIDCGDTHLSLSYIPASFGANWYNPSGVKLGSGQSVIENANLTSATAGYSVSYTIEYSGSSYGGTYLCEGPKATFAVQQNYPTAPVTHSASRCNPGQEVLSVTPVNGITYEWYNSSGTIITSGVSAGTESFTTPVLNSSQTYYVSSVLAITNLQGSFNCHSTQVPVTATINTPPVVSASATPASICTNATTSLSASGAVSYSWSPATGLSNSSVANPSLTLSSAGNYTYQVTGTDVNGCSTIVTVPVQVNPYLPVGLSISPSDNNICPGTNVTFIAIPTNGGSAPSYQWILNGSDILGATNPTYSSSTFANGNTVSCRLTSNATCPSQNPATSAIITMVVKPASITTTTISPAALRTGSAVSVSYTICGVFSAGNIFTAQLSDANGLFTNPVAIGTLSSINNGTINCTVPCNNGGTGYRIRVISSNPVITGSANTANLIVTSQDWYNAVAQNTINMANGDMVTGNEKVFYKGTDNRLYMTYPHYTGGNYTGNWITSLVLSSAPANVGGDLTIDAGNPNMLKILYRGTDNYLYYYKFDGSQWVYGVSQNWIPMAPGDIVAEKNGSGNVYYRGADNKLYISGTSYGTVTLIPNPVANVAGNLTIDAGRVRIFYRGTDNFLYYYYWNTGIGAWSYAQVHNWYGLTNDDMAIDATGYIYYRCNDNVLRLSGTTAATALIANPPNNVAGDITYNPTNGGIFYRGTDGFLYYYYWGADNIWHYASVQNTVAMASGDIGVSQNKMFFRGTDNKMYMSSQNAGVWTTGTLTAAPPANTSGNILADNTNSSHVRIFYTTTGNPSTLSYYFNDVICNHTASTIRAGIDNTFDTDNTTENLVRFYPNPTEGNINIEFTLKEQADVKLRIYNSLGILMKEVNYGLKEEGNIQLEENLHELSVGLYHCQLFENGRLTAQAKIMVIH